MFGKRNTESSIVEVGSGKTDFHKILLNAIAALTLIALALPIFSMIGIFTSVNTALFSIAGTSIDIDPVTSQLKSANRNGGIYSGDNSKYLKGLYEKLENDTTSTEVAKLATDLNIIFADFDSHVSSQEDKLSLLINNETAPKTLMNINKATRLISVDLEKLGEAAFVMISNRPVILDVSNQPEDAIGRVGIENKLPFDIINNTTPILAGFRVEAFNFYSAISPKELKKQVKEKRRRSKLCSAVRDWQKFFDVEDRNIKLWHAINPIGLKVGEKSVKSSYVKPVRYKDYKRLCLKVKW